MLTLLMGSFVSVWPLTEVFPKDWTTRGVEQVFRHTPDLFPTILSSLIIALTASVGCLLISMLTAEALVRYDIPGKKLWELAGFIPLTLPAVVFAIGAHVLFIRLGIVNTFQGVILAHMICALPYSLKLITDGMRMLGKDAAEQAEILGASPLRAFLDVTLPALMPNIMASVSMVSFISFSQFFLTLILGGPQIKTLSLLIVPYIKSGDRTLASIYSVIYILIVFVLFFICDFIRLRAERKVMADDRAD
jgi:putative spermidine/putrescine transport system permease protein